MSFYSAGLSALNSAQLGLSTTAHNINSATVAGFHRQENIQNTNPALGTGSGFIGQGVRVATIRRIYSEFLDRSVQQAQTKASELSTYLSEIKQVDSMLADATTGVSPALQEFFSMVGDVATTPDSTATRQALIGGASSLVARFNTIAQRFSELSQSVDDQIAESVTKINSLAQQIGQLNEQIIFQTAGTLQPANDLLDQREQLIADLNKQVKVTTIQQDNGSMTILIGTGQPLVVGPQVFTLAAQPSPDDIQRTSVAYKQGSGYSFLADNTLTGGVLGGLISYRNEALDPAQNMLGRVALGLAQSFNDQHRLGMDLSGNVGKDFFSVPTFGATPRTTNTGSATITTTLADVQKLTASDYRVVYTGTAGSEWNLIRNSDSTVTSVSATSMASGYTLDGITFKSSGGAASVNDAYLVQPTKYAARDIALSSTISASTIAAATPIRSSASLSNTGTGAITAPVVNSFNNKVTLTFTSASTFDVVDNTTGLTLASGVSYTSGSNISYNGWTVQVSDNPTAPASGDKFVINRTQTSQGSSNTGGATVSVATVPSSPSAPYDSSLTNTINIVFTSATTFDLVDPNGNTINGSPTTGLTFTPNTNNTISVNGWTVTLSGAPKSGDKFTVSQNTSGNSDNRNMLLLAGVQTTNILANGTTNIQDAYAAMVNQVGNQTSEALVTSTAQDTLTSQAEAAREAVSGVNLDEEAANLMKYQQAYQAASKMLSIATTLFDTLLSIGN